MSADELEARKRLNKKILPFTIGILIILAVLMVLLPSNTPEAPTPTPVAEQAKEYSILEITDVSYQNGQVKVLGRTDLPDGAILMMHLEAPTGLFAGLFAQGESKVENGEFTMVFDTKPYEVSALLTPVNQPDSVSRLVGDENEVTFKIRVYYLYAGTTTPKEKVFFLDVVRESAPYTLSSTGDWGVDPYLV